MKESRSERAFRLLLLLYPRHLRREFGESMMELFRQRLLRDGPGTWWGVARDLVQSWLELFRNRSRAGKTMLLPGHLSAFFPALRVGIRLALRFKRTSLVAVLALAAGVGVATYSFGLYYGTFMRGLPVSQPERMVHLTATDLRRGRPAMDMSAHDFWELRSTVRGLDDLAAYGSVTVNLAGPAQPPEQVDALKTTASLFKLMEGLPHLGRTLLEADHVAGAKPVVLLGFDLWSNRFGQDPDVVGSVLTIDGTPTTAVGVMPRGFAFPSPTEQLWLPLTRTVRGGTANPDPDPEHPDVMGRLAEAVSLEQAQSELNLIAQGFQTAYPETHAGIGLRARYFGDAYRTPTMETQMRLTSWTGLLILAIALANMTNLLLVRGYVRLRELAVRSALGAGRLHLLGQFLAESSVLAVTGGAVGVLLAWWGLSWYQAQWQDGWVWWKFELDGPALLALIAASLAACLVGGIFPALHFLKLNVDEVLRDQARANSSGRFSIVGKAFIAVQIGLGGALLFVAALMIQSALNLRMVDYGFAIDNVMTARVSLDANRYPSREQREAFWSEFLGRARSIPGVDEAALATQLPMIRRGGGRRFAVEGEEYAPDGFPIGYRDVVTPEFFETFRKRLLRGREFDPHDTATSEPVVIVNQDFVRTHFSDGRALGRRIRLGGPESEAPWMTVVGIAPHLWMDTDVNANPQGMYIPLSQLDQASLSVALRVRGESAEYAAPLRELLFELDPNLALYEVMTMPQIIRGRTTLYRRTGPQFIAFGAAALLVAVVGLYAVISFLTQTRTSEFGIRMALGAARPDVLRMVLRQGTWPVAAGIVLGIATALYLSNGLSRFLFELEPWDWRVLAAAFALLAATALAAMIVPALRATRIDPAGALRSF